MNTVEPVNLKELSHTDYESLIKFRIRKILMICSNYDAFILEEDGQIDVQIYREYIELNLTSPPQFVWVTSASRAREVIVRDPGIDLVICMYNVGDRDVFTFASYLKTTGRDIPFVLLTHFSKEIYRRLSLQDTSAVDMTFSWHGNTDLIVAIIKLFEDQKNADVDILQIGVQAILLVEDSVRYYSTYLPELYRMVLLQSAEFLKETLNDQQKKARKRSRPKILLATNYTDAVGIYEKYKGNMLGIISDIGFVMHKNDPSENENLEAGLELTRIIRQDNPYMPILLQSSQESMKEKAKELGCGFILKYSMTLLMELSEYISEEFVFGDFIFRDLHTGEILGRAKDLKSMQVLLNEIPQEVFTYHASRNRFSKWLFSRGLFSLGRDFRKLEIGNFDSFQKMREYMIKRFDDYRMLSGQGVLARFSVENYNKYIWFAKMGDGSIGGKARGLAFVNSLLQKYNMLTKYPGIKVMIPRSIVVATDYFDQFIKENGLQYVINSDISDSELLSEFVSSRLPEELNRKLRTYLNTITKPLAVRSSSKLEDSHFQPFAGIYSTYMIPVTENKDQMLRLLEKAIKSVYASVFFAASRSYIHTTANLLGEEKMAVLIQNICGSEDRGYFFPTLSGVARSINHYPISGEKPEDGVVDMAFGLGKLIVDGGKGLRFCPKYPTKILQLSTSQLALRDTQDIMYALNLEPDKFKTSIDDGINLQRFTIQEASGFRNMRFAASSWDMYNDRIVHNTFDERSRKIITFANILQFGKYPVAEIISTLLEICSNELNCPVEIEFAANLDTPPQYDAIFNLLQVRPITNFEDKKEKIDINSLDLDNALILSDKALGPGSIEGIEDIIYVKSETFDKSRTEDIAKEINALNAKLKAEKRTYMLIGPGRWGSSDPWLGVPILWNDISEARVIVETALKDFQIEPSQGTHFFQNITSLGVGYITVNEFSGDGYFKEGILNGKEAIYESGFVRHVRLDKEALVYIDGNDRKGVVII